MVSLVARSCACFSPYISGILSFSCFTVYIIDYDCSRKMGQAVDYYFLHVHTISLKIIHLFLSQIKRGKKRKATSAFFKFSKPMKFSLAFWYNISMSNISGVNFRCDILEIDETS